MRKLDVMEIAFRLWLVAFIATAAFFILAACSSLEPATQSVPENQEAQWTFLGAAPTDYGLYRYVDSEKDVICWLVIEYEKAGLACLPISDTLLPYGRE